MHRPDVKFFCDLDYDPFLYMEDKKKVYGFTISLPEYEATIPSLWETVKGFMKEYPEYVVPNNAMGFVSDDGGRTYNKCHFWSNFEIGDLDFWRGEAYSKFFEYLDSKGGFYYEVGLSLQRNRSTVTYLRRESTAMGRRSRPQHRSCSIRSKGPNSFL
ncbi:alpha-1,2-mannosyltransferase KRE2 [Marasmius oreades]|uniref:Alpha-1,2-mannosyltransferase KRE2 n=1 Tax=Marasmius oreades TaxID=181124 RepID=A0A9P7RZB8_9AGAR|nr:alpha-1,2-mannosyltransferase KRE2 [Marasmius oreades]KAG7092472.1 alpha-1,2-mannosyltransferase KRE2 [Marasmius oreades]